MLDKNTSTPLYQQIIDHVRGQIESGEYAPGQMLPSESMFCDEFGVSRITVRNAIQALVDEGLVIKRHGKGSFVNERSMAGTRNDELDFMAVCRQNKISVYSHVLQQTRIAAVPETAAALKLGADESVVYLERICFANYKPAILEKTYLSFGRYAYLLDTDVENQALNKAIEKGSGFDPCQSCTRVITLESSTATAAEAQELRVEEGTPLFVMKQTFLQPNGSTVYYTKQLMPAGMFSFRLSETGSSLRIRIEE